MQMAEAEGESPGGAGIAGPPAAAAKLTREDGEGSSARNPGMQAHTMTYILPSLGAAIAALELPPGPVRVADLGCSVGGVTLAYADFIVENLRARCASEIRYFFSDLPANNFNALFQQLPAAEGSAPPAYFAAGVPGSFYHRLFLRGELQIVITTWSLHWLSQVPKSVTDPNSPAFNRGRVGLHGSPVVADAFAQVSKQDLRNYFTHRAVELAPGGLLFVQSMIRGDPARPSRQFKDPFYATSPYGALFDATWEELVAEGVISAEKRDSFNIPIFFPSVDEIKAAAAETAAFDLADVKVWDDYNFPDMPMEKFLADPDAYGELCKGFAKGLLYTSMEAHIGSELADRILDRLARNSANEFRHTKQAFFRQHLTIAAFTLIRK